MTPIPRQRPASFRRITVFADELLEKELVDNALRLGADSYICTSCSGKALHEVFEPAARKHGLVRIELFAPRNAARAIIRHLRTLRCQNSALTAVVDAVVVCP